MNSSYSSIWVIGIPKPEYLFTLFIIYSTTTLKYNHAFFDSRYGSDNLNGDVNRNGDVIGVWKWWRSINST